MSRLDLAGSRGARTASLYGLAAALLASTLVSASDAQPRLVDGSSPPQVPRVLRAYGKTLRMTRVRVTTVHTMPASLAGCPEARRAGGGNPVVERVGFSGRSVTFLVDRTLIAGCDRNPKARATYGPWCGTSGWRFRDGRVSDARLDVCYGNGKPVAAFGWVNSLRRAKWVVVDQPRYREVYPVAPGVPVRVSTIAGLFPGRSVVFRTAQYDMHGVLLVRRKVVAVIAS